MDADGRAKAHGNCSVQLSITALRLNNLPLSMPFIVLSSIFQQWNLWYILMYPVFYHSYRCASSFVVVLLSFSYFSRFVIVCSHIRWLAHHPFCVRQAECLIWHFSQQSFWLVWKWWCVDGVTRDTTIWTTATTTASTRTRKNENDCHCKVETIATHRRGHRNCHVVFISFPVPSSMKCAKDFETPLHPVAVHRFVSSCLLIFLLL